MTRRRGTSVLAGVLAFVVALIGAVSSSADAGAAPCVGWIGWLAFAKTGRTGDVVWVADLAGAHPSTGLAQVTSHSSRRPGSCRGRRAERHGKIGACGRWILVPEAHTFFRSSRAGAQPVAWSPESRYLAVELFGNYPGKHDHDSGLAIIDTTTFRAKTIARGSLCGASFSPAQPDRLVFGLAPPGTYCLSGHVNVFAVDPDGFQRPGR